MSSETIQVDIGTKLEVFWTRVKEASIAALEECENNIHLHKGIIDLCKKKIKEEKKKIK